MTRENSSAFRGLACVRDLCSVSRLCEGDADKGLQGGGNIRVRLVGIENLPPPLPVVKRQKNRGEWWWRESTRRVSYAAISRPIISFWSPASCEVNGRIGWVAVRVAASWVRPRAVRGVVGCRWLATAGGVAGELGACRVVASGRRRKPAKQSLPSL